MTTPERGLVLKLHGNLDGISMDYKFKVTVNTDSDYARCPNTIISITGSVVYLNEMPVMFQCSNQKTVSLSTTKAELNAAVVGVEDALFVKKILKSLGLKVKLPILVSINSSRSADMAIIGVLVVEHVTLN